MWEIKTGAGVLHTGSRAGLCSVQGGGWRDPACFTKQMGTSISRWLRPHSRWRCTGFLDLSGCPWCCHCVPPQRESLLLHCNPKLWPDGHVHLKNDYMTWPTQNSETALTWLLHFQHIPPCANLKKEKSILYKTFSWSKKKKSMYVLVNVEWKWKYHPELTTKHTLIFPLSLFSANVEVYAHICVCDWHPTVYSLMSLF